MTNDGQSPHEAVEQALAEFKKAPDQSIYKTIEEIEKLIATLEDRVENVKKRLQVYERHTVTEFNEIFAEQRG